MDFALKKYWAKANDLLGKYPLHPMKIVWDL
jgi:hypothetical protein